MDIHQQIGKAEKRLEKLNTVEGGRLAQAGVVSAKAIRSCKGAEGVGEAKSAAEEGARVGEQLTKAASSEGRQERVGATIARRGKGTTIVQLPPATLASVMAARQGGF